MNSWHGMGRLTQDPEVKTVGDDLQVCTFTVAINRKFAKDGERQADFINCVAWRKTAEFIEKYFKKGDMIALEGSIQTRSWEDDEGKKRYATEILVDQVHFTGGKNDSDSNNSDKQSGSKSSATQKKSPTPPPTGDSDDDEDLPF